MPRKIVVIDEGMSAVENLARNEACFESVRAREFEEIVRVYSFKQPGVILAKNQSAWDVQDAAWDLLEVTRRRSGGGAVYVDENTLGYSVFGRIEGVHGAVANPTHIPYQRMRSAVMEVLRSFGLQPKEERHWGVRVEGGVVAGHAQRYENGAYEVHGLVRLRKWNLEAVAGALKLRKCGVFENAQYFIVANEVYSSERVQSAVSAGAVRVVRDEQEELRKTPGLDELGVRRELFVERLVKYLSSGEECGLPAEIVRKAKEYQARYADAAFVRGSVEHRRCLGHCFVDLE